MPRGLRSGLYRGRDGKRRPFFEKPLCRVQGVYRDERKYPSIEASDDVLLIYLRLCKAGYAGSLNHAKEMTAREVLQALNYETFCNQYEQAYLELNKG